MEGANNPADNRVLTCVYLFISETHIFPLTLNSKTQFHERSKRGGERRKDFFRFFPIQVESAATFNRLNRESRTGTLTNLTKR